MFAIKVAKLDAEILRCFPLMAQLRTHLVESEFVSRIRRQIQTDGYQLAFLEARGGVVSLAGYRFCECLYSGKFLYVDDLVTDESCRSQGYGATVFAWLVEQAKAADCDQLRLDSGVQRFGAHRFYLGHGMDITCHHFALKLK